MTLTPEIDPLGRPVSDLVVVGGDAAGMSAASQLKRRLPESSVTVMEQGRHISYAACGMPYMLGGVIADPDSLLVLKPDKAVDERGIEVRLRHRVVAVDLNDRKVTVKDLASGSTYEHGYRRLLLATGARPVLPAVPKIQLGGIFTLRDFESGLLMKDFLDKNPISKAVIAGSGLVGLEMAEALASRGIQVALLKRSNKPLLDLEPDLSASVHKELVEKGCTLLAGTSLEAVEGDNRVSGVWAGKELMSCQILLLAMGIRPVADLAEAAGISLGAGGAVDVSDRMETSADGVYAAGDCASQILRLTGEKVFLSSALAANRQGRMAGAVIAESLGGPPFKSRYPGTLGTMVTKVFDLHVASTGLGLDHAKRAGFDAAVSMIRSRSRAHYYPGSKPITVALVFDRSTRRLLGGQIVGGEGVSQRINVIACALHNEMTIDELANLDTSYAPPFSPVWDPLLIAASAAQKKIV